MASVGRRRWELFACVALCACANPALGGDDEDRSRYERQRAAAHASLPNTMYASTPSEAMAPHAATDSRSGESVQPRSRPIAFAATARTGQNNAATLADVFRDQISPLVQEKCIKCHVADGVSAHTRLVFTPSSNADHLALNQKAFEDFVDAVGGGAEVVLNKIRGVGHGGGIQIPAGGEEYADMEGFLALLGGDSATLAVTPKTLFDGVRIASNRRTLRRAALIFAGRVPTPREYAALGENGVRATIRSLMRGQAFHDFLIRSSNDRLLTDREDEVLSNSREAPLVSYVNEWVHRCRVAEANIGFFDDDSDEWVRRAQYGARRAPLELIAHVVENDLPYTEILTADYIMVNPWSAQAYGSSVAFDDPEDVHEFQPATFGRYYLYDETREFLEPQEPRCGPYILDPGALRRQFPHAGILNTMVFLRRYPTTATNRNRARSRWTYYHFLGLDIEKSAGRTTDADALADTDNPTLKNPACTVCHSALDPIAGAFQNYNDIGHYRANWGGRDSLDDFYKRDPTGGQDFIIEATSFDDRERVSMEADFEAGTNAVGFRVIRRGEDWPEVGLADLVVRDRSGNQIGRYRLSEAARATECAGDESARAGGRRVAVVRITSWEDCILPVDVEVTRAGRYLVEVDAWNWTSEWGGRPPTLRVWAPGAFYRQGDTWYQGMLPPGFGKTPAPNADNSVQWLAQKIVSDDRFAEAAVKFWWPAIMGEEVADPPEEAGDADFDGKLLGANAQALEVARLARAFRRGIGGGSPHNLKDLLVELVLSKWFRAEKLSSDDATRAVALRGVGAGRLLTGEELAAKTLALTGVQWGRLKPTTTFGGRSREAFRTERHALSTDYAILYGGIDSDGVTERARELTAVMVGVAKRHAIAVSCPVVLREFYLLPDRERLLFRGIDPTASPANAKGAKAIRGKLVELYDKLLGVTLRESSSEIARAYAFFERAWTRKRESGWSGGDRFVDRHEDAGVDGREELSCDLSTDEYYFENFPRDALLESELADPDYVARTWVVMLAALLMDHRYLHL